MRIASLIIKKDTDMLQSFALHSQGLEELEKKVNDFNENHNEIKALLITDKYIIQALEKKESKESVIESAKEVVEKFEDYKSEISAMMDSVKYTIEFMIKQIELISKDPNK